MMGSAARRICWRTVPHLKAVNARETTLLSDTELQIGTKPNQPLGWVTPAMGPVTSQNPDTSGIH